MKCPRHPLFLTIESELATGTQELLLANLSLKRKDVPDKSSASFEIGGSVNLNDPLLLDILNETSVDLWPSQVSSQAPKGVKKARKHNFDFTDVVFTV